VGFCLGGLLAYLTATRTNVDAAVAYYGVGIERFLPEATHLKAPLLLHIAAEDQFVPNEAQALILRSLGSHPLIEAFTYEGQDHAFARDGGEHYNPQAAQLASERTLAFLTRAL